MNKDELKEYNNEIRRMLQHEDNIRNQRTSWFLVLQGLLINGILLVLTNKDFDSKSITIAILLLIGTIISFSFLHAARLSHEAYREGKQYWHNIITGQNSKEYSNTYTTAPRCSLIITGQNSKEYPPVCLLEEKIINLRSQNRIKLKTIFLPYIFLPLFFTFGEAIFLFCMFPSFGSILILLILYIYCYIKFVFLEGCIM